MKRWCCVFLGIALIFLLGSAEAGPHVLKLAKADLPPPRTTTGLKELAVDLMAATPDKDKIDSDADGLYDTVEIVIGTAINNTDSDFDQLSDYYEVFNNSLPWDPDSNGDGLPDYYEVTNVISLDPDGDGVQNVWDFDNDGDGINDGVDLSPFAKSAPHNGFLFDIKTGRNPIYVTFQLRPKNPEHLKLFDQFWDWPDTDSEDPMKDLDNSKEDVKTVPILNLTANVLPDPSALIDYGIAVNHASMQVPLFPVFDQGNIVAFGGKLFYPSSETSEISIKAELVWRVMGNSDQKINALKAYNGKFVTINQDNHLVANSSETNLLETLMWVELGDNRVALGSLTGVYLSVGEDALVTASSTEIGEKEIFTLTYDVGNKVFLKAWNNLFVSVDSDGILKATGNSESSKFELTDLGYWPNPLQLAAYKEDFILTGFSMEENYGSEVGLVYGGDLNQSIAANLLLAYDFLRNTTTTVANLPTLLSDNNLTIICDHASFQHIDEAFLALTNVLLPSALDSLPDDQNSPIITVMEDRLVTVEMSEILGNSTEMGNYSIIDLSIEPVTTTKALKTNWHNTTTNVALELEEIAAEMQSLGLNENVTINLVGLISIWNIGERTVTKIGTLETDFELPELDILPVTILEIIKNGTEIASVIHGTITDLSNIFTAYQSIRFIANLKNAGWSLSVKGSRSYWEVLQTTFSQLQKVKTGLKSYKIWSTVGKGLNIISGVLTIADVGFTFYSLFSIINAFENPMELNKAVLELFMELTYNVILFNIGLIPVIGWLLSLGIYLSDLFGDWTTDLFDWIISLITRVKSSVTPAIKFVGEPSITVDDKDGNGLDVGDRIYYTHSVIGNITGADWTLVSHSTIYPYVTIEAPPGSSSNVGPYAQTEWVFQASDLGQTGNDIHLWLPIPPSSTWTRSSSTTTYPKWDAQQYQVGGWIEPGIAMANFPVTIKYDAVYQLDYNWEHFVFLVFYAFWCEHTGYNKGITNFGSETLHFDVMPATLDDFISWRGITQLDHDGDGLRDSDETLTNAWNYDTDADGLNDAYEMEIGTNPKRYDTDNDGLLDSFEMIYNVDPADPDTDGDGIPDYLEETGWLIALNYTGNPSLTFTMHVTSDPKIKDTDADGIDDLMEYWSGLNPRSYDTDADGIKDVSKPNTQANYELKARLDFSDPWMWLDDVDVFSNGTVLVLDRYNRQILSCNLDKMSNTTWNYDTSKTISPLRVTIDEENGLVHIGDAGSIKTFDFNGSWIKTWGQGGVTLALEFDSDGNSYILRGDSPYPTRGWIDKYNSNGTLITSWDTYGPDNFQFREVADIAVDSKNGYLYMSETSRPWERGYQIVKFDLEGNWLSTRTWSLEEYPSLLEVDKYGFLYVIDSTHSMFKFDSNGMNLTAWYYNATGEWNDAFDVDMEGNVYVGSVVVPDNLYCIQKFSPQNLHPVVEDVIPDRDGDGLENDEETAGWDVVFTNQTGIFLISVTSDQLLNDTDSDGLTDYQENNLGTNPKDPDTDDDGLTDYEEWSGFSAITNPKHWDTDGDGLGDGDEITYGSDPTNIDTDGDGLSDLTEFNLNSDATNTDTDRDGLQDSAEIAFNSNPNSPDSDGDLMFDNTELNEGTNPQKSDTDNDGIYDGYEMFLNTSPLNSDTDGDNIPDGTEVLLRLNPLSNDTDQDGLLDSSELEYGTNPFNEDSDGDGIPDGEDFDSNRTQVSNVVLSFDSENATLEFSENLALYTNVTVVSKEELIANYTNAPYIVLVGKPNGTGSVGTLIHDLLLDSGDTLTKMTESDVNRFVVRYGLWNNTQTVVMLSTPYPFDHLRALELLRSKTVTIMPDSAIIQFNISLAVHYSAGGSLNHTDIYSTFLSIDEIDTLKATDSILQAVLEEAVDANIQLSRYNASTTPFSLTTTSGLGVYEKAVGKYLDISASENVQNGTSDIIDTALIQIYYKEADLDKTVNGIVGDPEDLNEDTLMLYYFDETAGIWVKLSQDLGWVVDFGVNTTNVELYGQNYAGYVWARVSHLSFFGLAGLTFNRPPDVSDAYPSQEYLWPPNKRLVPVKVEGVTDPDGDEVTITVTDISSNEAIKKQDAYGVGTNTAWLIADRSGRGGDRIYVISFVASDGKGGETVGSVKVYVPHDMGK